MGAFILQYGCTIQCPHGGTAQVINTNMRVKVGGNFALLATDTYLISGCPFQVPIPAGTKPQPCVTIQWLNEAQRVKVGGKPVLLQTSTGICKSVEGIPQGSALVTGVQTKVQGS
jgi:hypothetical protein